MFIRAILHISHHIQAPNFASYQRSRAQTVQSFVLPETSILCENEPHPVSGSERFSAR